MVDGNEEAGRLVDAVAMVAVAMIEAGGAEAFGEAAGAVAFAKAAVAVAFDETAGTAASVETAGLVALVAAVPAVALVEAAGAVTGCCGRSLLRNWRRNFSLRPMVDRERLLRAVQQWR